MQEHEQTVLKTLLTRIQKELEKDDAAGTIIVERLTPAYKTMQDARLARVSADKISQISDI